MIQDLGRRMEQMQEMFPKDLEKLKNNQPEMSSALEGINSRITEAEEWISDLEDRIVEITTAEQNIEKEWKKKNEDSLKVFLNTLSTTGNLNLAFFQLWYIRMPSFCWLMLEIIIVNIYTLSLESNFMLVSICSSQQFWQIRK